MPKLTKRQKAALHAAKVALRVAGQRRGGEQGAFRGRAQGRALANVIRKPGRSAAEKRFINLAGKAVSQVSQYPNPGAKGRAVRKVLTHASQRVSRRGRPKKKSR